jgi:hypothetical protein
MPIPLSRPLQLVPTDLSISLVIVIQPTLFCLPILPKIFLLLVEVRIECYEALHLFPDILKSCPTSSLARFPSHLKQIGVFHVFRALAGIFAVGFVEFRVADLVVVLIDGCVDLVPIILVETHALIV